MEITVDLTRKDYADFNKYYFLKKRLKRSFYIVLVGAFIITVFLNIDSPFDLETYLLTFLMSATIYCLVFFGWMLFAMKLTGRLPSENGSILGKKKFKVTDEGLLEESESNTNLQKWKGIKSVETNENSVFIFVDKIAAYVIPKRFFKDEAQQNDFIRIIEQKMGTV
jgi:hypothetical protein